MADLKTLSTIDTSPFKKLVLQLGGTPSAFSEGMTYYELLSYLVEFLEKEVVPKTNENIEAVKELQEYVSTYFDNLDVQEEINNKLDQMAEDGTLEEIINQGLFTEFNERLTNVENTIDDMPNNLNESIVAYPTLNALVADENISEGQTIYVKGETSEGDGFSGYYNIKSTGTANGQYVIALNNGLFAHLQNQLEENFYSEITYKQNRANNTDYFTSIIPLNDDSGNPIELHVVSEPNYTPNVHAVKNNTTITMNASLIIDGGCTAIGDGVILNNRPFETEPVTGRVLKILAFKEDRTALIYPTTTEASAMIEDGVKNAFVIFGQCVTNGTIDNDFQYHIHHDIDAYIGQKANKDLVLFTCNGRNSHNQGMNFQEVSNILLGLGCIHVYAIDGGGSTSLNYHGIKLGNDADGSNHVDRYVPYLLDIKKTITNKQTADIESQKGTLRRLITSELMPVINDRETKHLISRYHINSNTTSGTSGTTTIKNYTISSPLSDYIQVDSNGIISIDWSKISTYVRLPYDIKISGHAIVHNLTGTNTSAYIYTYEDTNSQVDYVRQTIPNSDYATLNFDTIAHAESSTHNYHIAINNPSNGTFVVEYGDIVIDLILNSKAFIG